MEQTTRDDRLRSLGGEVLGDERCVRRRLRDICRQRASFFLDLDEQPGLNRLHGIAILSDRLPSPARNAILADLHTYLSAILDREWPDMQRRNESRAAGASFQSLWQTVETVNTDPADNQIRGQLLNLLAAAHQSRETRLFQMTQGVPGLVWGLLIILASGLIGCMLVFAAEASTSKAVLVGVFTASLTLALLTVRVLDFPFESALQLSSSDFNETLEKVDHLIAAGRSHGPRTSE